MPGTGIYFKEIKVIVLRDIANAKYNKHGNVVVIKNRLKVGETPG